MGAEIAVEHGFIHARCTALCGTRIVLEFPSVGATENLLTAAVLAKGETVIENAAREPEITDLTAFLNRMGAHVIGAGTSTITVEGVDELVAADTTIMGLAKRAVDDGLDGPLARGNDIEAEAFVEVFGTQDAATGVASFLEHGPGKATFAGR